VLDASPGADVALINVNMSAAVLVSVAVAPAVPVVPAVPAVPVVPATPAVPVVPAVITPCFRQPITVICASVFGVVLCGADVVCAPSTVAKLTIAVDTPVQIVRVLVMKPPGHFGLQPSDRIESARRYATDEERIAMRSTHSLTS